MKVTVLLENATPSSRFIAKHGLSLLLETGGRRVLFDMGPDESFLHNAHALGIDVAVSTTGVAGPEPHDGQPVGTVWLGAAGPRGLSSRLLRLEGDREQIRRLSVRAALEMLVEVLGASQ